MEKGSGKFVKGHKSVKLFKYTDEDILNEGSKYDSPTDFKKGNCSMYSIAVQRKLTKLINYKKGFRISYYSDEFLIEKGSRYDNPKQFIDSEPNIYSAAQKRNILKDIKYKVGYIGNKKKRLVYTYTFSDNHIYVGLTYNDNKRELEHRVNGKSAVSKHIKKTGLTPEKNIISDGYIDSDKAQTLEEETRLHYISNGWVVLNKVKAGGLGGNTVKWTESVIREVSKNYNTREELKDNVGNGFITVAKKLGIYDEITKHMNYMVNYFTKDEIISKAKNYRTIQEFRKENESMYVHVHRNNLEDEVYKHMENGKCEYILDLETGVYYLGVKDAYESKNFNFKQDTLNSYLNGKRKNKTSLVRV
jgi:predicted GIY-YIG superfamily endonuclease